MSRTYDLPTSPLSLFDSRPKTNDAIEALRSVFSGAGDPAGADLVAFQFYVDDTASPPQLKQRDAADAANVVIGDAGVAYLGLLTLQKGGIEIDADGDSQIVSPADDEMDIELGGSVVLELRSGFLRHTGELRASGAGVGLAGSVSYTGTVNADTGGPATPALPALPTGATGVFAGWLEVRDGTTQKFAALYS